MRILFTIPHYFNPQGSGFYGSLKADPRPRLNALANVIYALHGTFGRRQGLLVGAKRAVVESNTVQAADIDVVICTTGENHLVGYLRAPGLFRHHATTAKPMLLGYECHAVLRDALGQYDYYCFLEDDLLISDPLFFQKLEWFNHFAGDEAVLLPNRFETARGQPWLKLYIDGNLRDPRISARYQDVTDRPVLAGKALGMPVRFQRVDNPHCGGFFLNARQMAQWAAQPYFLDRDASFISALESAASLGVMRSFRVYKPSRENAGFLELLHLDNRYLGKRFKFHPQDPHRF